jgi:GT2 family glycosyltransferase
LLRGLGCFDENFFPVYYEDADYRRRARLAGLQPGYCPFTSIQHGGSRSLSQLQVARQNHATWTRNREYFNRKWGGDPRTETYEHPFNDSRFSYFIDPVLREAPYHGLNRTDHDIVKL